MPSCFVKDMKWDWLPSVMLDRSELNLLAQMPYRSSSTALLC